MNRPEWKDFGLTQADVTAVQRYDKILAERKETKEFLRRDPWALLFIHVVIGLGIFLGLLLHGGTLKQATIGGMVPFLWTFGRTFFELFWHRIPSIYYEKKKVLNSFQVKEAEYIQYYKEKTRIEKEQKEKARSQAREVALRASQAAEHEKKNSRQYLEFWQELDGVGFEQELATLLRDSGYKNVSLTAVSGDDGIDLWADDPDGITCIFQCKAYQKPVSLAQLRELLGALASVEGRAKYGVMVALSGVTGGGEKFAEKNPIVIWDGDNLVEMAERFFRALPRNSAEPVSK